MGHPLTITLTCPLLDRLHTVIASGAENTTTPCNSPTGFLGRWALEVLQWLSQNQNLSSSFSFQLSPLIPSLYPRDFHAITHASPRRKNAAEVFNPGNRGVGRSYAAADGAASERPDVHVVEAEGEDDRSDVSYRTKGFVEDFSGIHLCVCCVRARARARVCVCVHLLNRIGRAKND